MADEISKENKDIISLETLVGDAAPPDAPAIGDAVDVIDEVLSVEDPAFAAELAEIRDQGAPDPLDVAVSVDEDVDTILALERAERHARGLRALKLWLFVKPLRKLKGAIASLKLIGPWMRLSVLPALKNGLLAALKGLKAAAAYTGRKIKAGLGWFSALPMPSKLLVLGVVVFAVASVAMVRIAWRGSYLPTLRRDFLVSFAPVADHAYEIEKDEAWEDLNDPLLHPEHIVLIERLIVNLRPGGGEDSNPMAMIDLYVEAGSQDAAVEVKDREAEMRDMILRTMEQMSYEDLAGDAGKNKLKIFLRKNLNDMMVRGRVRRVFFKSIVVKS